MVVSYKLNSELAQCFHLFKSHALLFSFGFQCKRHFLRELLPEDLDRRKVYRYLEIKCQLDAKEVFIVDLIACSTCFGHHYAHHQELKSIIQWLLPVVFRATASCKPET